MSKVIKILLYPLLFVEIIILKLYKFIVSPNIGNCCAYIPTCSSYMYRAVLSTNAITGLIIGLKRLRRCNGKNLGGIDLEPLNILGDYKWVC